MEVDARPSDAIAIGLRFNAPIFTYETILEEAGIILTEETEEEEATKIQPEKVKEKSSTEKSTKPESLKDNSYEKLSEMLEKALAKEDYETAARIRDEMNRRN